MTSNCRRKSERNCRLMIFDC
ncbi:MAG: hypothetical protein DMG71_04110 [Acidobacteria bacterium]|nr:MAG: hypothetical protein DMG71_04110 [Acidobacteriota bacterium]